MGVKDVFMRGWSFVDKQIDKLGPGALREISEDNTNLYKENHQLIVQNNELMNFINEQRVKMEKQDDIISSLEADKKHLGNLIEIEKHHSKEKINERYSNSEIDMEERNNLVQEVNDRFERSPDDVEKELKGIVQQLEETSKEQQLNYMRSIGFEWFEEEGKRKEIER